MDQKISLSRSEAFRQLPSKHWEQLDEKLIRSLKEDHMIEDEKEKDSRERLLEAQYGAANLRNVMQPRYMRGREGKQFRVIQKLDGVHIDRDGPSYSLFPMDPDPTEKESDMVGMLQSAVANSEAERNKYLKPEQRERFTKKFLNSGRTSSL
jgi:hypothetical protein